MLEALVEEVGCGFFAADASRTEEGDLFVSIGIEIVGNVFGELGEGIGVGIDRAFEGADFDFVLVAGVDDEYVWIAD